eukprot:13606617-Alexandrium_andersonii.AAC.1
MSASLVGSEMCIRDSSFCVAAWKRGHSESGILCLGISVFRWSSTVFRLVTGSFPKATAAVMSCEVPANRAAASLSRSAAGLPRPSQIRRSVSSQRVSS